ncbi:MAG: NAD-dependent dehydratase [Spirochaetae bacterium HGW-Spirochaetae-3]|jgi:nucleoside-diphosphate-sugar epimerase|nr:MAG: NAD-dependent dehydratase [Spirochaetae bacterium HGW-Spirochaetae-3]
MRLLVIGGTGNISYEFTEASIARGFDTIILTRGTRSAPDGASVIMADASIPAEVVSATKGMTFDAVVDFLCYEPDRAASSVEAFNGRTGQYVFISSASAYQKPPLSHVIDERTPLMNPFWAYSRDKIACERVFMDAYRSRGFPVTIVRPSHTYGRTWIPTAFVSSDFTVAARMLAGKEIIVPGDGQSLWTLTHARDFAVGLVGLLGRAEAVGEAFTIAGDETHTWDAIHRIVGDALGARPRIVHVPSEFIAAVDAAMGERLLGDKAYSAVFDCSKLRRLVPEFRTTVPLERGIIESVEWRRADPSRMAVDGLMDERIENILAAWKKAMDAATTA